MQQTDDDAGRPPVEAEGSEGGRQPAGEPDDRVPEETGYGYGV